MDINIHIDININIDIIKNLTLSTPATSWRSAGDSPSLGLCSYAARPDVVGVDEVADDDVDVIVIIFLFS